MIPRTHDRRPGARLSRRLAVPALLLGLALLLPGCDNPACVFGGDCSGNSGGLGENPASVPRDGETIEAAAPQIVATFPDAGTPVDTATPIVLVFSETIVPVNLGTEPPSGLGTVFELSSATTGQTIPLAAAALLADGRVLVLLLPTDLQPGTQYDVIHKEDARLADRTGQTLARAANGLVGSFTTAATPTDAPSVIATWPTDLDDGVSATTEIVVVFDRPIDEATVTAESFVVTVDGAPPAFDALAEPLRIGGIATDTRVFLWRSLDAELEPASLGEGVTVEVSLSGAGHAIEDLEGNVLPATTFEFETAPFSAPISAAITSDPTDAIGIDNISGPATLAIEALLSGAQAGDFLVLTMFGFDPSVEGEPTLIALRREVAIEAPFDAFTLTAAEIDLLAAGSPVAGRFADGPVAIALQIRRGDVTSPVTMLDVDPLLDGPQHPLLDTVAPQLLGLSTEGTVLTSYRSDVRDLVLVGRASEPIARASVSTPLGDNETTPGVAPPVVGSDATGTFVAAPVRVGVLDPAAMPVDFDLAIFDRALNSAIVSTDVLDPTDGFRQLGASGPGNALPGGTIGVEVFDATTLAPIADADVHVAENVGGTVSAVAGGLATTDAGGFASVPAAAAGETIVTVEKAGYDLVTIDGVPTDRLSVGLTPTGLALGSAGGTVGPLDQIAATQLNVYTRAVADSRRGESDPVFANVAGCGFDGSEERYECPFGPIPVRPRALGAQSAITVLVPPSPFLYSALTFLKTAELFVPIAPVAPAAAGSSHLPLGPLLDAGTLDPEERPVDAPAQLLSTVLWPGLTVEPVVAVQAVSPGIPAAVTVGRGIAFDDGLPADTWSVRAAYPGSADGIQDVPEDPLGRLVTGGTIEGDLLLRVEVGDAAGNKAGARPRLSALTGALAVPMAPAVPPGAATPNPGGMAFDLTFPDVLPDLLSAPGRGLQRVVLEDALGRRWSIYRPDPSDAQGPNVVVHVPDLAGSFPLAPGPLDARVSVWSWPTFDLARVLWTDLEREHDAFAHSVGASVTPP